MCETFCTRSSWAKIKPILSRKRGFEPPTFCVTNKCAHHLRYFLCFRKKLELNQQSLQGTDLPNRRINHSAIFPFSKKKIKIFFEYFVFSIFSTNFEQAKKNLQKPKKFFFDYSENKAMYVLPLSKEEYSFFDHERYFFFFSHAILFEQKAFFGKESIFSKKQKLYPLFLHIHSERNSKTNCVAHFEGFYDVSFFEKLGREDSNL